MVWIFFDIVNIFSINFRKLISGLKIYGFGKMNSVYVKIY